MSSGPGGPPANPVTMKVYDLLEGGEWHRLDDIFREAGKVIQPGVAIRRNEKRRQAVSTSAERKRPLSEDRRIEAGRRDLVRDSFNTTRAYHEMKVVDGERWVRATGVPPRVARDRARARAHFHLDPELLADEIAQGADAVPMLGELSHKQLMKVALVLARRERDRYRQVG